MMEFTRKINDAVANSIVGRRFRLHGSGHAKSRENARFLTEIRAGLATFFAMAYIISVGPKIFKLVLFIVARLIFTLKIKTY